MECHNLLSDSQTRWFCPPSRAPEQTEQGTVLKPDGKTDYWRNTYYQPVFQKDDGHFLFVDIGEEDLAVEAEFVLTAINNFDQAGVMVRADSENWIKAGVELSDSCEWLSVVVTRDDFSDWSTQKWGRTPVRVRLVRVKGSSYVVQVWSEEEREWAIIRVCHMPGKQVQMGIYTCAPTASGGHVVFTSAKILSGVTVAHTN
eukprot:comp16909_c0_seq1/m.15448 comp16909_c0_seq1/g.15448  ORF comp16909_c0_seq1/g.15448 comp16909_c0_seq1/m.15448 type:complete len:201 (-) comp16909_c0_seq1:673-1275(-)